MIKLYAWELPFQRIISKTRQQELNELRKIACINAVSVFMWTCVPLLVRIVIITQLVLYNFCFLVCVLYIQVALVTFATYSLVNINNPEERLTADKAFVALALFDVLRFPLAILPILISNMVQATVSVKRLSNFLKNEELDPNIIDWQPEAASGSATSHVMFFQYSYIILIIEGEAAVTLTDSTFSWDSEDSERATLKK